MASFPKISKLQTMLIDVNFPRKDAAILATNVIQTIHLRDVKEHVDELATINLIYDRTAEIVPGTQTDLVVPDNMAGSDYLNGVRIDQDGCATFKVKILALSSQHKHQEFRFRITINTDPVKCMTSVSFRTLSKVARKRKIEDHDDHRECDSDFDLLATLANVFDEPFFFTNDTLDSIRATHESILEKAKQVASLQNELYELNLRLAEQLSHLSNQQYAIASIKDSISPPPPSPVSIASTDKVSHTDEATDEFSTTSSVCD